ncbi:pentachlorophenol 4-monooxygenase [Variibacter gotjawalensis]|uniref:Pentachlorophenol 4-monooxygenase n=1 Tax=Variibacter gotjawalensis TaxID=1333996 RepID=A0A0S3PVZ2_9BRAD|nr:FAD-dependent monooxygenase [Variibacter gotjawalensis]NIK45917.1 2-polyprenyl-6-methoxyphenol hydroxylase-like FAD-dependent oxidoreductase [Variibacter gotjawalensis]RZS47837.1 2-polyprenyl-6-methoxyphenol hydroxylase-like FAD-dependent oxidoreductase [Variibacter gotjawalensis]BAT60091.1 pentachlorophenol 4-monooxygenase [Variibacter gotjawalensis]
MMQNADVVIAGAGPTGLMLAGELALAGIDVAIVERRETQGVAGSRAGGLHSRSIEVLDQRGIADRFLSAGTIGQVAGFAWIHLDISDFPTRHPYGLALWQNEIERILAEWVSELGVPVYRGREVAGFAESADGVDIALSDGGSVAARYLVGCDGGRSIVRKTAGIAFAGSDPTISHLIAEVELGEEPAWGLRHDAMGIHGLSKIGDGDIVRVMVTEQQLGNTRDPDLADLSAALTAVYGTDYGIHSPRSISRFTDMTRQAEAYRKGRVLLAGDAAHVHYPAGGQGLNTGLQDAVNLGWKLAQVVEGISPDTLLDSYHAERHPVAARVLHNTMAQVALLRRSEDRLNALRQIVGDLLDMDEPRKRVAAMTTGLDVHYDLGDGHPLLGRRMPDLALKTDDGRVQLSSLLHSAKPLLLNLGDRSAYDVGKWSDRVSLVDAAYDGVWELPVIGEVPAPAAVLIRPDGHVAWVAGANATELSEALQAWFGAA